MRVKLIYIKKENKAIRENIEEGYFKENLGLLGDVKSKGGDRQVSILSFKDRRYIEENPTKAICMNRFHENITIEGLQASALNVGDKLEIGETIQEITSIGKICFEGCSILKSEEKCPLAIGAVFTKVVKSGKIKIEDNARTIKN